MCDPQTVSTLIGLAAERRKQAATREFDRREKAHDLFLKQQESVEANMTELLIPLFRNQIESAADRLDQLESQRSTKQAAGSLADTIFDPSEWKDELIDRAAPGIAKGIEEGIDVALAELRVRPQRSSASGTKTTATEWLEQEGAELPAALEVGGTSIQIATERPVWLRQAIARVTRETFRQPFWDEIAGTTKSDIERVLRTGLADGLSVQEMGRQLRDLGIEYYRRRGLTIARTESANSLNAGRVEGIDKVKREMPAEVSQSIGRSWLSVLSNVTRDTHAMLDGVLADENGMWTLAGVLIPWPAHFNLPVGERANCFPAGTLVQGDFTGAQRVWYEGVFTEIVLRFGGRITMTPNHPVVTSKGLVPAGEISPGQKIMTHTTEADTSLFSGSSCYQEQNEPVPVEQVFEAFFSLGSTSGGVKVRRAQVDDFYGDGEFCSGDIEIVRTDGSLLVDGEVSGAEEFSDSVFTSEPVQLAGVPSVGASGLSLFGIGVSSPSFPSFAKRGFDMFRGFEVPPSGSLPVGVAADFNASLLESSREDGTRISGFLRQSLQGHSRFVSFDDVVEVRNFYSGGHVYDLQSKYGTVIAGDPNYSNTGIVTSNCQCSVISVLGADVPQEQLDAVSV